MRATNHSATFIPASPLADSFLSLVLELGPSVRFLDVGQRFTEGVAKLLGARAAALALTGSEPDAVFFHDPRNTVPPLALRELNLALQKLAPQLPGCVHAGPAAELLGEALAKPFGWQDLIVARLNDREREILGVFCLADRGCELSVGDRDLLQALAAYAAVMLENGRLLGRIEQSKKQWVEIFDSITDFIVVHDPLNRILRVNHSLANFVGALPSALIGQGMPGLTPLVKAGEARSCPFCLVGQQADEERIYAARDRTYLVSTSRMRSEPGSSSRTIHVLKDITDRRQAERRLQRERDFNTQILNNTQSMILVLDTAGLVSYANRRSFEVGYGEEELLGRPLTAFVAPSHRSALQGALNRTLCGQQTDNLELPLLCQEMGIGRFSVNLSPMCDEQGNVNSIVVVMTNITDVALLQAKLRHTEKMAALGQLVSGVAHEVNNPLTAIVGFTDLLLECPDIPQAAKGDLRVVLREALRTKVIVQNLLSFARQTPAKREPVQVNSVVRQTLQLRAYDLASHGVEVIERLDEQLPEIVGDAHQLQQVFLNILNNAYDAITEADAPGRIEIETSERDGFVEVLFRDNGPGLTEPDRIFEPFFTTKEVGKGTGLGLSVCYGIVREHGGEIVCHGAPGQKGSAFVVRLPVTLPMTTLAAAEAPR